MRTYYCYSCLKASVLVVNLLVLFLGLLVTGLATWLLVSEHLYLSAAPSSLSLGSYLILGVGLLVSTLAFLGCCGALTTSRWLIVPFSSTMDTHKALSTDSPLSRCLLVLFSLLLTLLTVAELTLVVLLQLKEVEITPLVSIGVKQTVEEKYHPANSGVTLYWDNLQQGLKCCGADGPQDWQDSLFNGQIEETREIGIGAALTRRPPFTVPLSCCRNLTDPGTLHACQSAEFSAYNFANTFEADIL